MPAEDYTLREVDQVLVVQIDVDNLLSVNEVGRIGGKLTTLAKTETRSIVLDLAKVRYAGSAALGLLVSISKALQERGAKLVLIGTTHLETLFKVSRTLVVFEIAPDLTSAISLLKK